MYMKIFNANIFSKSNIFVVVSFVLVLCIFGYFYTDTILSLPLFGDATIHGLITKKIITQGIFNTDASYPPLYNLIQLVLFKIFGEVGMNLMTLLGLLLLVIATYLYTYELIRNHFLSLISIILVLASPKIIFYSSRMYMEIFLSAMLVFSIYQLVKYLKFRDKKSIIVLGVLVGLTAATKQQGLMILFTSIFVFLSGLYTLEYIKFRDVSVYKHLLLFLLFFSIIATPAYFYLYKNAGQLVPGGGEFKLLALIDRFGRYVSDYNTGEDIAITPDG